MEVIVPCAGLSKRFPNLRPKYLLNGYDNKLMIEKSLENLVGKYKINIAILEEHNKRYNIDKKFKEVFGDSINLVILPEETKGPADTVYQTLKKINIDENSPILIKDCDSYFDIDVKPGNIVYVVNLKENLDIKNISAKSFVSVNRNNIINNISEKEVTSNYFCCGAYQFESVSFYNKLFENNYEFDHEIYVSNIIKYGLDSGEIFLSSNVKKFVDVGTLSDWLIYNSKPTYFCDIDGVLVKTDLLEYDNYEPLNKNINALLSKQADGCKIVFCTARSKSLENVTRKMLDDFGFVDYELVMGLYHSRRVLINDFSSTNPYPSSVSLNLKRNSEDLEELL